MPSAAYHQGNGRKSGAVTRLRPNLYRAQRPSARCEHPDAERSGRREPQETRSEIHRQVQLLTNSAWLQVPTGGLRAGAPAVPAIGLSLAESQAMLPEPG